MTNTIILVAETGSDMTKELARELGVILVPMHVSMGDQTLDDGTFPPEEICAYYARTGQLPTTSGSTIYDFASVYDRIFAEDPDARVLHLAYSAVTTCSFHSSRLSLEDKPYQDRVRLVDTKQVSVGQCAAVSAVAAWLKAHPQATLDEAAAEAETICAQVQMCFIPQDLTYLRAGGRCSNVTALLGDLLQLHPCIEIVDGKLIARKKYRGSMSRVAPQLLRDFDRKHGLLREQIHFAATPHLDEAVRAALDAEASAMGFQQITWSQTGCVITCHSGPGAFGIVGSRRAAQI